jgi:hypothetical protein
MDKDGLAMMLWGLFLVGGGVATTVICRSRPTAARAFIFLGIFVAGLFYASQVTIVEERMHLINFSILGWLLIKDIRTYNRGILGIVISILFCAFIAAAEGILKIWIPDRVAEVHDVLLGIGGSVWGMILFFCSLARPKEADRDGYRRDLRIVSGSGAR